MPYIPNTEDDRRIMLEKIGVRDVEELLLSVPQNLRLKEALRLPAPMSELELVAEIEKISRQNRSDMVIFAGGGLYDHFIPAAMSAILTRPEFVTAYTPYQAEVAQGTLQVIYEFQTHICRLTGMDVANASMYDGASAAAEAAHLAVNHAKKNKILIADNLNPLFREVIRTYLSGLDIEIISVPHRNGLLDLDRLASLADDKTAGLIASQPNYFGLIEDCDKMAEIVHQAGGIFIMAVDPIAAAILKTPAESGADIVVGEGQPLGIPLNFGGPLLGFFAARKELIRLIPGRLAARTVDETGKTGFVLTLQTREQHIRREKATSNICTNQALCAAAAAVYLSLMGPEGLRRAALLSMEKTHQAAQKISSIRGYTPYFDGPYIREVVIRTPKPAKIIIDELIERENILAGIDLGRFYPDMQDGLLLAATEKRTDEEIDRLAEALKVFK
jgi:glycine dehydrogenase subunit 1